MPKLLSPVVYAEPLDGLNAVRPLVIGDEVEQVIDFPVVNANPVDDKSFARGKLLRCDNNGVLLKSNHKGYDNVEIIDFYMTGNTKKQVVTFSQRVNFVLWEYLNEEDGMGFWWCDNTYTIHFLTLSRLGFTNLPFNGTKLYIIGELWSEESITGKLYGFYN